jgi:hypothetical protein
MQVHAIKLEDNHRALYFLCVPRISQFAQLAYIISTNLLQPDAGSFAYAGTCPMPLSSPFPRPASHRVDRRRSFANLLVDPPPIF